jgi:hypothetical protein
MLGSEGSRGLGARNIALVVAVLSGLVFGSTAWGQGAELPVGVRIAFTALFVLLGFGVPWLLYLALRLLGRLFRRVRRP